MNDKQVEELKQVVKTEFEDFKQLFRAELSQTETNLEQKLGLRIEAEVGKLRAEMQDGFDGIAEIIEGQNSRLDDHDTRIVAFEAV